METRYELDGAILRMILALGNAHTYYLPGHHGHNTRTNVRGSKAMTRYNEKRANDMMRAKFYVSHTHANFNTIVMDIQKVVNLFGIEDVEVKLHIYIHRRNYNCVDKSICFTYKRGTSIPESTYLKIKKEYNLIREHETKYFDSNVATKEIEQLLSEVQDIELQIELLKKKKAGKLLKIENVKTRIIPEPEKQN